MKNVLIVVDMQNDFIDGTLGTKEAVVAVDEVIKVINNGSYDKIYLTQDTHYENYPETLEGKKLPVTHCVIDTNGWDINESIMAAVENSKVPFETCVKPTFGSFTLLESLRFFVKETGEECSFTIVGVCTDICVISNALMIRALYPNSTIVVYKNACAGVTPEKHLAALEVMNSCQIDVM